MADEKKKKTIAEQIDERVQAWIKNAESFTQGANAQFSTEGYRGNTKEYYDSVSASVAASQKEAETIRQMLKGYGSYVGDDYVKNVTKYLDDFAGYEKQILDYAKQDYDFMSRYPDADYYNRAMAEVDRAEGINKMSREEYAAKLDSLASANSIRKEMERLQSISDKDIYQMMWNAGYHGSKADRFVAQYKEGIQGELSKLQTQLDEYGDITDIAYTTADGKNVTWQNLYDRKSFEEDLANQMVQAKSDPEYIGIVATANDNSRITAYRGTLGEAMMMRGEQSKDVHLARAMTQDEADLYAYYLETQGEGRAEEYFRSMYEVLDRRATDNLTTQWKDIASEHPGLSSAISIGGTIASGAEYLADLAMQIATGKEQYNTSSAVTSAIRGTVAEAIDWTIGNWDAGAFVYNTFMSGVDSLVSGLAFGGGGGIALGLSAAASATNDALDRGLSSKQAFWSGLASGVFEGLFEAASIGQFGAMKEAVVRGGKDFAKNLAKSMVTNATEEFATEVANVIYDNLANLDFSAYETDMRMYMAMGLTAEEAHDKAKKQVLDQLLEAAASGALMGIGFSAVGSSISAVNTAMNDIDVGDTVSRAGMIDPLVALAQETTSEKSKAYKIASKVNEKTSAYTIGKLLREVEYNLTEQNKTEIQNALIERGMGAKEAKKATKALVELVGAESLEAAEEAAIRADLDIDNDTIASVLREVIIDPNSSVNQRTAKYNALTDEIQAETLRNIIHNEGLNGVSSSDKFDLKKEAEFYGIAADEFLASAQASKEPPAVFARAFKERYLQGKSGDTTVSKFLANHLSERDQQTAYKLGELAAKEERRQSQTKESTAPKAKVTEGTGRVVVDSSVTKASRDKAKVQIQAVEKIAQALGIRVRFYESVLDSEGNRRLSSREDASLAPNGWFDADTNTVNLDIYAGKDGKGVIMFTLAHELTHFIAKWSKTQFNVLADFVTSRYAKEGKALSEEIRIRMRDLAKAEVKSYMNLKTEEARYEYAREEVIADSMETMFASGNVMRDLADLKTQSEGLFNKIRGFLKQFADKIRALYKKISPETAEGKFIAESKDAVEELEKLFANALKVSAENYAASGVSVNEIIEQDVYSKNVVMNLRLTETHIDSIEKAYNASEATVPKDTLIDRYKAVISIWKKLGGELNSAFLKKWDESVGKDRSFTIFKKQVGYKYNVELSTMCKKGVPLFEAIDFIVRQEVMKEIGKKALGKAEKEILYDILKSHNFEIPCAICYVEQARQREGAVIDAFLDGRKEYNKSGKATNYKLGWNEVLKESEKEMKKLGVEYSFVAVDRSIATDSYVPTDTMMDAKTQVAFYQAMKKIANKEIARYNAANPDKKNRPLLDKMTNEEFKKSLGGNISNFKIIRMLIQNPAIRFTIENDLLYSSMTTLNLASAHNDLYSLFNSQGGVSGYKSKQGAIIYWGDILAKKWKSSELRKEGGVRNQSNSDFQMYTLLDQVQMYVDFTAKGYYLQAYTKVLAELKLFGKSRAKINASLIPRVHIYRDANGEIDVQRTMENAGLDENGNLIFDDVEGIPHEEAFMLLSDPEYSKNIGGVCIGYSDNHIFKLLNDPRVQLIIGFHDKTNNPDHRYKGAKYAKNYNDLNEAVNAKGETVHVGFNQFVAKAEKMFTYDKKSETFKGEADYNGKTYVADDIPRLAADLYLGYCEEKGYQPAYTDFDSHPNYYKLLADFSLYDSEGHYAPHKKVAFNMPTSVPYLVTDGSVKHESSEQYIKKELRKELAVRDSLAEALGDTSENGIIPQFKKRIEYHLAEENESLLAIVSKVKSGVFKDNDEVDLGTVSEQIAKKIKALTKIDVNGFKIAIEARQIKHILLRHGEKGKQDKSMANDSDIAKMKFALTDPDDISRAGKTQAYTYFENGRNKTADTVLYEKVIGNESYYVVQAVPDTKAKTLFIVTAFIGEKGYKKEASQLINAKIPDVTSENGSAHASTTTLPQTPSVVKTQTANSSPNGKNSTALGENDMQSLRTTERSTMREVLADALDEIAETDADKKALANYKKKVAQADELDRTLAKLRAKKKALTEAKAKRSEIIKVQDEITKTQNRITIIDKQLFNLQSTVSMKRVLESEKNRRAKQARAKQKAFDDEKRKKAVSDSVKEAEDDYQKKLDEQKKHQAEIEARRKDRADRTVLRHGIIKLADNLDRKLLHPTKEQHVPLNLQKAVAQFLKAVDRDSFAADPQIAKNLDKIEKLIEKADSAQDNEEYTKYVLEIEKIKNTIKRAEAIGNSIQQAMATLRAEYDAIIKSEDPRIRASYDKSISEMLAEVYDECGNTPLRLMTTEQLTILHNALKAVAKKVSDGNKTFKTAKQESIDTLANRTTEDFLARKNRSAKLATLKKLSWGLLKPAVAMELIGSDTLIELYENLANGELTWMENRKKAKKFVTQLVNEYNYHDWDMKAVHEFTDRNGKKFTMTLGEMMSVYAYSKRPQARNHLLYGGIKLNENTNDKKHRNKKDRTDDFKAHPLSETTLNAIIAKLGETKGLLAFCDKMQAYLSHEMADLGNEISSAMYDILAYTEENYFPIKIDEKDKAWSVDKPGEILLVNRSFTKTTTNKAANAILLSDFTETWTRHVEEMITYNAFALQLQDLSRVYNYNTVGNKESDGGETQTEGKGLVKSRIAEVCGEGAAKYIEQLMTDVNGGVIREDATISDAFLTKFKRFKVVSSTSVVIQQPSATARAFAMVDPKYFRGIGMKNHAERWERVKKYAKIAEIKEVGRFDVNLGLSAYDYFMEREYTGVKEKTKAVFTDKNYRDEILTRAPAYADEMAWITIFEACEREMRDKYKDSDLIKDEERFMRAVGERFTEVVRETQVYDSVFSRAQIMRSQNPWNKMITAFMAEPLTTLNMAVLNIVRNARSNKSRFKKVVGYAFNRTNTAIATSIILNSILVSFVYAMRDDDEDETYWESYVEKLTAELVDSFNPITYIPLLKDLWSILQGYDVERPDVSVLADVLSKTLNTLEVWGVDTSEMSEAAYDKWLKEALTTTGTALAEYVQLFTDLPLVNIIRDTSAIGQTIYDSITSDREISANGVSEALKEGVQSAFPIIKPPSSDNYDPTYSDYTDYTPKDAFTAFDRGNTAKGKEIIDKLIKARMEAGDTEKEAKAALRSSFTSTYKEVYKKAYNSGDNAECVRIRKLMKESGLFPNYIETYIEWQKEALADKYTKK